MNEMKSQTTEQWIQDERPEKKNRISDVESRWYKQTARIGRDKRDSRRTAIEKANGKKYRWGENALFAVNVIQVECVARRSYMV